MFLHCKQKYGVNCILAAYEYEKTGPIDGADFQTGDIDVSEVSSGMVFLGDPANGAFGDIGENHKLKKIREINSRTDQIIQGGFIHNGKKFRLREEDQRNAMGLMLRFLSGQDLTGQFFRAVGESYNFIDNNDFSAWYMAGADVIEGATSAGSTLKDMVTNADNTDQAMSEIIDNR